MTLALGTHAAATATDNRDALARDDKVEKRALLGLSAPAIAVVLVICLIPTLWLFYLSFINADGFTGEHYRRMIDSPSYGRIFYQTFEISVVVTLVAAVFGYPTAYLISQLPPRWSQVCLGMVLIPFWTSLLVRTYAWLVILQRKGIVNEWLMSMGIISEPLQLMHNYTGTVIGMVHIMMPFLILPSYAALKAIDRNLMLAAANLGASPVRAFWSVFFPLSLPGLIAGALLVFILCLGFYVTPALLGGGRVMLVSMKIQQNAAIYFDWGAASALGVVLLVATILIFVVLNRALAIERVLGAR